LLVKVDCNGFVWESGNSLEDEVGCTLIDSDYFFGILVDMKYQLPLYKVVSDDIVEIGDPLDYIVDQELWAKYLVKLNDEVHDLLSTYTLDELKVIYDQSPDYKKDAIFMGIEYKWAGMISQHRANLSTDILLRMVFEYLHIKEIEKRELTPEESSSFGEMLENVHSHSHSLGFPMKPNQWYHQYVLDMLVDTDFSRVKAGEQRLYVTGRV